MQQGLADHKFGHSPFGFRTDDGFIAREDRELRGNPQIPPDDERQQHQYGCVRIPDHPEH